MDTKSLITGYSGVVPPTILRLMAVILACCSGAPPVASAEHFNVLMIGNSYTKGRSTETLGGTSNDVQGLFDTDPIHTATVVEQAFGSWSLRDHANDSDTTNLITSGADIWDVIVLQDQSTVPSLAMKFGDPSLNKLDNGAPPLIDLIKQQPHLQQTSVILFNTWARSLDESTLVDRFNNDPNEMQFYTNLGYDHIRENSPSWDHSDITTIAHVGDAWDSWYDTYGYGVSTVDLHDNDGIHQSGLGSYLAAAVIYETITGDSSIGNTFTGTYQNGVSGAVEDEDKLFLLQQQASATTGVAHTADFDQNGKVDGRDILILQRGYGPNRGGTLAAGDGNLDGAVDSVDLGIWQEQYGSQPIVNFLTVPEPSNLALELILVDAACLQRVYSLKAFSRQ